MKGIVLAGGSGTRLYPLTLSISKQLLPIYDKPMIYYPLSTLMLAGIRDILIISTPKDTPAFQTMFGDGTAFGLRISYAIQPSPKGLAEAFIIGEDFIGKDSVALVLGDNVFYGDGMRGRLAEAKKKAESGTATIFGYYVNDPKRFGIAQFDQNLRVISVEEKPRHPKSNYAIVGLYFFDNRSISFAKRVTPSKRGELEITSIIQQYIEVNDLSMEILGRGFTWLDTGTQETLAECTEFVRMIENHQGMQLSCLEEISYLNGWMTKQQILQRAKMMENSPYGRHLLNVAQGKIVY
jgi:glucose-1-phosphate thymidylyltransferase